MTGFADLGLDQALVKALDVQQITTPTPIQAASLPAVLKGDDVLAQARTGTGKTIAFGLGVLAKVDPKRPRPQALVLCPTRELADQVAAELRRLARFVPSVKVVVLTGGVPSRPQTASLQIAPHVVVGTPGRVLDHVRRGNLDCKTMQVLVLDEADRMLDMGFAEDILEIVAATPAQRQTLLFSATYPENIRAMSGKVQRAPVEVKVDAEPTHDDVEQVFYEVEPDRRNDALCALLLREPVATSALVFCVTKIDTDAVTRGLQQRGFAALALHGDMEQRAREEVLIRFANKSCSVLVATDVAARGLDIAALPLVVSYELPTDPDVHVHRIGRTARAGEQGRALALFTRAERGRVTQIEERLQMSMRRGHVDADKSAGRPPPPAMVTLLVDAGRREKLRPGDLLGALTGDVGLPGDAIGKIDVLPTRTYVAVARAHAERAQKGLDEGKIKARSFRVRRVG